MFFLLFLLSAWQGANVTPPCRAHLEMKQQDGMLSVTGHCRNLLSTAGRYRYELSMMRESAGGHSQNTQRGEFDVAPQQEVSLSHTTVNASAQDTYRIYLRVLDLKGQVVAQDSATQIPGR
jgi:hypothetical protein